MAQAEPKIARRSIFAAVLMAPGVVAASKAVAATMPPTKPGMIWVQVPEEAWNTLLECGRYFAAQDRARR